MKLFGLFALLGSAFSEDGVARLIASKTTESKILAQNVDLTFTYKIFNIGQGSAFNVVMKDENFGTDKFEIVKGAAEATWEAIEKDSSVTHEVTVRALNSGSQNITSAVFTYKTAEDGEEITMFSSDYGTAQIIEEREYLRKHASHLQDWVVFVLLSIPSLLFPYLLYFKSKSKYEGKTKRS